LVGPKTALFSTTCKRVEGGRQKAVDSGFSTAFQALTRALKYMEFQTRVEFEQKKIINKVEGLHNATSLDAM
jgi:hypothetical protein